MLGCLLCLLFIFDLLRRRIPSFLYIGSGVVTLFMKRDERSTFSLKFQHTPLPNPPHPLPRKLQERETHDEKLGSADREISLDGAPQIIQPRETDGSPPSRTLALSARWPRLHIRLLTPV
jgi:hypothetical protein